MLHKCPNCKQQTLEDGYDSNQDIPFYICNNKECESYGKQMTDVEVE